ncbi:MAG: SulP family inorganic anion transporter [Verrucomicrobiota bacterium]
MDRRIRHLLHDLWKASKRFVVENPLQPFPLGQKLEGYSGEKWKHDFRAGINVALLAFPQGMAYAVIAGLPLQYGITCSIVAALIGPILAGSRHTILGPTNATSFMIFSYFAAYPALGKDVLLLMPLTVFMAGVLLIIGAYTRAADLIQYISRTVVVGYISGAALLIMLNQSKEIIGVTLPPADGESVRSFFTIAWQILSRVPETNFAALGLSAATLLIFLTLRKLAPGFPGFAMTLVIITIFASILHDRNIIEVATFGSVDVRDIANLLPNYDIFSDPGVFDRIYQLFGLAFAIAFLASLENSVMAKSLASKAGERVDLNQDMLAVGVANIGASVLSGMPASGSLTRSALNFNSGAVTPVSSLLSAFFCLAMFLIFGGFIEYIPKCALAMLVICIAVSLINTKLIRISLAATGSDAVTLVVTFLSTLILPLHVAIFLGVGTSIMLYLRKASRPHLVEYEFDEGGSLKEMDGGNERMIPQISIVHVEGELFFGAAELFRTQIQRTIRDDSLKVIILRLKNARHLDATSVMALEELIGFLRSKGRDLIVSGAMKDVYRVLRNSGLIKVLGKENLFLGSTKNPNLSTRNALKRAQEILGTEEADIRIFFDPSHS